MVENGESTSRARVIYAETCGTDTIYTKNP
jgi:hypothetical protein